MAVNVQAAPFVNRLLQKTTRILYPGFLHALQLRMAKVRNDKNPYKSIYMHYIQTHPRERRNTDSPHSPPFFPLPLYDPELIHDVMMETRRA